MDVVIGLQDRPGQQGNRHHKIVIGLEHPFVALQPKGALRVRPAGILIFDSSIVSLPASFLVRACFFCFVSRCLWVLGLS